MLSTNKVIDMRIKRKNSFVISHESASVGGNAIVITARFIYQWCVFALTSFALT